jgi:hypothetical protein
MLHAVAIMRIGCQCQLHQHDRALQGAKPPTPADRCWIVGERSSGERGPGERLERLFEAAVFGGAVLQVDMKPRQIISLEESRCIMFATIGKPHPSPSQVCEIGHCTHISSLIYE